jgi:magnesium transporter
MIRLLTEHAQLIDWTDQKPHPLPDNLIFLDLLNPSRMEEVEAEQWLEYQLPTREEMQEIEESSRLYSEKGALYMTAWVPVGLETPEPDTSAITFVVSPDTLTTVRYSDPLAFRVLVDQVKRQCTTPLSSDAVFLLLVEMIVARIADTLQNIETDLRGVSRDIFAVDPNRADGGKAKCDLNEVIKLLGRRNALVANLRECLVSIARMLQYFLNNAATWMKGELAAQFRSVARDVKSLDDYTNQQTQEMAFLLDSTLGLISIQQNQIIKIFTVASVLFMPPTLIASIYGMNVDLPVQENPWAFLVVMVAVVMSAILPILYFKKKKLL